MMKITSKIQTNSNAHSVHEKNQKLEKKFNAAIKKDSHINREFKSHLEFTDIVFPQENPRFVKNTQDLNLISNVDLDLFIQLSSKHFTFELARFAMKNGASISKETNPDVLAGLDVVFKQIQLFEHLRILTH